MHNNPESTHNHSGLYILFRFLTCLTLKMPTDNQPEPPTGKVRVGFIGAGNWAVYNHIPLLKARDDVELAAVCTLGAAALARVKTQFGFEFATENYRELLARPLDAVVISTPHGLHYTHALAALQAGCHVLVEKPMALRAAEAWHLARVAREMQRHLMIPYGWHYTPMALEAKALIEQVGQIEFAQCHMASALRALYSGQPWPYTVEHAPDPEYQTYGDPATAGGGQGMAQLSHSVALLLWLTGLRAAEVFAFMSGPGAKVDLYDAISIRFVGGAIGAISGAGTLPPSKPRHQLDVRIFGSEGVLLLDLERERLELLCDDGQHIYRPFEPGAGAYACDGPLNRFVDLVRGRQAENLSPGELGARAVEVLDAAYRSAASGKAESVPQEDRTP